MPNHCTLPTEAYLLASAMVVQQLPVSHQELATRDTSLTQLHVLASKVGVGPYRDLTVAVASKFDP